MNDKDIEILEQRIELLHYRLSQITPQNAAYSGIKKEYKAMLRILVFIKEKR